MSLQTPNRELSASESRYRGLVDHAPIGIFTTKGMQVTFSNRHNQIFAGLLINVIDNAIDASPMDGPALEITAQESSHHEQSGVMIQIRDAGKGIAPAALARVFEPFLRRGNAMGPG